MPQKGSVSRRRRGRASPPGPRRAPRGGAPSPISSLSSPSSDEPVEKRERLCESDGRRFARHLGIHHVDLSSLSGRQAPLAEPPESLALGKGAHGGDDDVIGTLADDKLLRHRPVIESGGYIFATEHGDEVVHERPGEDGEDRIGADLKEDFGRRPGRLLFRPTLLYLTHHGLAVEDDLLGSCLLPDGVSEADELPADHLVGLGVVEDEDLDAKLPKRLHLLRRGKV